MKLAAILATVFCASIACAQTPPVATADATPAAKASLYSIEPGTQVVFETSGSLRITGDAKESQDTMVRTSYTALQKSGPNHTLFAGADQVSSLKNGVKETTESNSARFTFELDETGDLGERTAGVLRDVFTSWNPRYDFPQLPVETSSTVTVALPVIDQVAQAVATRREENGNVVVEQSYQAGGPQPWEASGLKVKSFSARYIYSPADKLPVAGTARIEANVSDPTGREVAIAWSLDTKRVSAQKLPQAQMDALKKDVLAGAPVFDNIRAALVKGQAGTSEALKVISGYTSQFPKGQFVSVYADIQKQLERQIKVAENISQIREGNKAPDFTAKTIDGETIKLSSLRGRVVLIDFWATWCGPCVAEMPGLKKLYDEQKGNGFSILGISADQSVDQLKEFLKENDIQWKQVYDTDSPPDESILVKYGVNKFPTTILLDREGTIRIIDARGEELAEAVGKLVQEK